MARNCLDITEITLYNPGSPKGVEHRASPIGRSYHPCLFETRSRTSLSPAWRAPGKTASLALYPTRFSTNLRRQAAPATKVGRGFVCRQRSTPCLDLGRSGFSHGAGPREASRLVAHSLPSLPHRTLGAFFIKLEPVTCKN